LPAATQHGACRLGAARFDEFATQVERRLQRGSSLMQETIDRLGTAKPGVSMGDAGEGRQSATTSTACKADFSAPSHLDDLPEDKAAGREDGSTANFPTALRGPLH
jgi:hypothetical protein